MGRILIAGAGGQLGSALRRRLAGRDVVALDHAALDVADGGAVAARVAEVRPSVVINATAYNLVDAAEKDPGAAFRTNAAGPWALAVATRAAGALLVHVSSDYVFAGDASAPYVEEDVPAPRSVYGASKLAGERLVEVNPLHMVIRTAGVFGTGDGSGKGRNFVDTMIRLGAEKPSLRVVSDQRMAPTSAGDLAAKTIELVDLWERTRAPELLGLYHVTNAGDCSWLELACEVIRASGGSATVEPITAAEYGLPGPRPAYSVLARTHLHRLGLDDLRPWQAAVAEHVAARLGVRLRTGGGGG